VLLWSQRARQFLLVFASSLPGVCITGRKLQTEWPGQLLGSQFNQLVRVLFGSLYNNIKPPSWLGPNTDFHLFKEGVEPKWEDPTCEHGGKWTVLIPRSPNNKQTLDTYWLNAVGTHRVLLPAWCAGVLFAHSQQRKRRTNPR
jgi:hypothetical protein